MGIQDSIQQLNDNINTFFSFIFGKVANFKNLSLGEQISYCGVGAGFIMVLAAVVLFVV